MVDRRWPIAKPQHGVSQTTYHPTLPPRPCEHKLMPDSAGPNGWNTVGYFTDAAYQQHHTHPTYDENNGHHVPHLRFGQGPQRCDVPMRPRRIYHTCLGKRPSYSIEPREDLLTTNRKITSKNPSQSQKKELPTFASIPLIIFLFLSCQLSMTPMNTY